MRPSEDSSWRWPTWSHLRCTLLLGAVQGLWFGLVYGGASYLTSLHTYRIQVHLAAELAIPFVPASVLAYLSLNPLLWLAPFILSTRRELEAVTVTMMSVTLAASLVFLLFPVADVFQTSEEMGSWAPLVAFARTVAMANNYFPSLHVTLAVVYVAAYVRRVPGAWAVLLWLWAGLISLSTLLLHQHYLADVAAGWMLGLAGIHGIYRPWLGHGGE